MTTHVPPVETAAPAVQTERQTYLNCSKGFWSWAGTLDHKRIGIMYLIGTSIALLSGGLFALLVRLHLWEPTGALFDNATYNQVFTLHGVFMVFLFVIPAIPAALGNMILPLQLGAPDVALPRLNLLSFYLWVTGAVFALLAIIFGGFDTGWTFYTPYSLYTQKAVGLIGMGVFILGFSSIFTGLNFIVTVHKMRAPGLTWFRMPLFIWALYATSILQVLATPVLGITVLLVAIERLYHIGIFDPR
ncbi:MAG: cbb3-type cytochrome c oxidase subunit I, partial [Planctomycetes bacterium]|nr:cbb3-type cytochrome c oxidase subunit I [Planctomycetota bacterium]